MIEPGPAADTLGLGEDAMRALGYQVVDMVVDYMAHRSDQSVIAVASRDAIEHALGSEMPHAPSDPAAALALLHSVALQHMQHGDHPRYFARVPSPSSFAAVLGDWLATGFNAVASTWAGASGPATVELIVIDWLRRLLDMPAGSEGVLVSGGSMGNFTAMAAGFAARGRGVVYLNDQTHASIKRNLRALGVPAAEMRVLATGKDFRFDMPSLAQAIAEDRARGRRPAMVVASAGTINTGASDPLRDIAALCAEQGLWMHVDGAYGAPAAFTDKGRAHLDGIALADSVVFDPHKWLFQPYDCGCVLVRHGGVLQQAFAMNPEYLKDLAGSDGEIDMFNRTLELTRRARAFKLWMTFKTYGVDRIKEAIGRGIELAEFAESIVRGQPEVWELITPAQIGVLTFARRSASAGEHVAMVNRLSASGFATLSTTELAGRSVLRLCTINPLATELDITLTLGRLAELSDG